MENVAGWDAVVRQLGVGNSIEVRQIDSRRSMVFAMARQRFDQLIDERVMPLIRQWPVRVAVSMGKDSTLLLALFVEAHRRLIARGEKPAAPLIVSHGDTLIESPVMSLYAFRQLSLLNDYCKKSGIDARVMLAQPSDRYSWPVMYIGGLKLPTVGASRSADCSIILKQDPMRALERKIADEFPNIVTATGVRSSESAGRAETIRNLGLDRSAVVESISSRDSAPLHDVETDEVWLMLRVLGESARTEYGDCLPYWDRSTWYLRKLYADSDSQCPITAGAIGGGQSGCGGSSLRSGCALCTTVNVDKQAEALSDLPQYPQLRNLLAIRNWISRNFANMSYRRYIARKPNSDGYVKLEPNTFNERWMQQVLRWCLQADRDEQLRADGFARALRSGTWVDDEGVKAILADEEITAAQKVEWLTWYVEDMQHPTFRIVSETQLLMIDAFWSRDAYKLAPFSALRIWNEVYHESLSVPYPDIDGERVVESIPPARYIFVEPDPELGSLSDIESGGVFGRYLAGVDQSSLLDGCQGAAFTEVRTGRVIGGLKYGEQEGLSLRLSSANTERIAVINRKEENDDSGYVIDREAAELICWEMPDHYLRASQTPLELRSSNALRVLIGEGVLRLSEQAIRNTARMMARGEIYQRAGLTFIGAIDDPEVLAKTISEGEYLAIVASREPVPEIEQAVVDVSVEQQQHDLAAVVEDVLELYDKAIHRQTAVAFSVSQFGAGFRFDSVNYGELLADVNSSIQSIRRLLSSADSLLKLLPANASLRKGRSPVQSRWVEVLRTNAVKRMTGATARAVTALLAEYQNESKDAQNDGLHLMFIPNGGGMAFFNASDAGRAKARAWLAKQALIYKIAVATTVTDRAA